MGQNSASETLAATFHLGKFSISIPITATALTGYIVFSKHLTLAAVLPMLAVFLLASGSSALNQLQEKLTDAMMERTRFRPLPAGKLTEKQGLLISIVGILSGLLLLYLTCRPNTMILGAFTVLWYNGVYTPLKKLTAFAVVPGALVGALPPLIGWTAAGGRLADPAILSLSFVFFMAQMPHFWLIMLRSGEEYAKAGFPVITSHFSSLQLRRLILAWIVATACSSPLLMVSGIIFQPWLIAGILIASGLLILAFIYLFSFDREKKRYGLAFTLLNTYVLLLMLASIFSSLAAEQ